MKSNVSYNFVKLINFLANFELPKRKTVVVFNFVKRLFFNVYLNSYSVHNNYMFYKITSYTFLLSLKHCFLCYVEQKIDFFY